MKTYSLLPEHVAFEYEMPLWITFEIGQVIVQPIKIPSSVYFELLIICQNYYLILL